jgi:hypothetical protein
MFADLDESIRQMLITEVPLNPNEIDISFERPDRTNIARFARPTADLFMFDVTENVDVRETGWRVSRTGDGIATLRWPPIRVDVRYLVTCWASAVEDQHRLLFHLYRALRRLAEIPEEAREGLIEGQTRPLAVTVEDDLVKDLVDLWAVLDNAMQPGFILKATVAIDINGSRDVTQVKTSTLRLREYGRPSDTRQRLGGQITDATGQPIAGARVLVGGRLAETDLQGHFNVSTEDATSVDIQVTAPGMAPATERRDLPSNYDVSLQPIAATGSGRASPGPGQEPPAAPGNGAGEGGRGRRRR